MANKDDDVKLEQQNQIAKQLVGTKASSHRLCLLL